jgi:diguanylate cyclase (GGDEF)-like protein
MRGFPLDREVEDSNEAWEARLHPDDLESVREHVRQQNSGEIDHFSFEYRERRVDDGRWIWILARGKTVEWDEQGGPTRLIGTDIDITKLKDEEARRAAEIEAVYQQHLAELEKANRAAEAARAAADALARLDPLSNLANRRAFSEEIERLSSDALATPAFAVLLVDLDRFKPINDMHGHAVGDMVIKQSAQRIRASVSNRGMVARLGGDEFGVILKAPETEIATMAGVCAEALIAELSRPIVVGEFAVEIGASIGLATFPTHSRDADALFRYADMALYEAKHTARGTWSRYSRSLGQLAESKAVMETEVRRAIAREEIQPHFQPIVDMRTGKVVKLEMLARWPHPVRGSVPPDRFIPIIEQLGLMSEFSLSMVRRVCRAAKAWPADIAISINLTTHEICDLTTPLKLLNVAMECEFPPTRLEIEITEKALVKDIAAAKQVIAALRFAGVKVMLDDFGAGYSGLGYLRELAFDCIKIDRSFIANLCRQDESRKIVGAIQSLAESLDLATVAEGIEDQDICEVVKQIGCTYGQGFYFSKPVPAAEVAELLNRQPQLRLAG